MSCLSRAPSSCLDLPPLLRTPAPVVVAARSNVVEPARGTCGFATTSGFSMVALACTYGVMERSRRKSYFAVGTKARSTKGGRLMIKAARRSVSLVATRARRLSPTNSSDHIGEGMAFDTAMNGLSKGLTDQRYVFDLSHKYAKDAATMVAWIDSNKWPNTAGLPGDISEENQFHFREGLGNPVRWSLCERPDINFMVFRGTSFGKGSFDACIDFGYVPCEHHGLDVHNGMLSALRRQAFKEMKRLHTERYISDLKETVICGHSFGGGYAILAAMELLHIDSKLPLRVAAFGAPQVVVPKLDENVPAGKLWHRLNECVLLYVNAWDVLPRVPSCKSWLDLLPGIMSPHERPNKTREIVNRLREYGSEYDICGSIIFIAAPFMTSQRNYASFMRVPFDVLDREHRMHLTRTPDADDKNFLYMAPVSCHHMTEYKMIVDDLSNIL